MKLRSITTFAVVAIAAVLWAMPNNTAIADGDGNGSSQSWQAYGSGFGVTLDSSYEESTQKNGSVDQKLEVEVHNAPANTTVAVTLNGAQIGTLKTNRHGEGTFKIAKYGVKAGQDGRPVGARIDTGDVIEVSSGSAAISGTFQKDAGDDGNGDNGDDGDDGDDDGNGDNDNDGDGN